MGATWCFAIVEEAGEDGITARVRREDRDNAVSDPLPIMVGSAGDVKRKRPAPTKGQQAIVLLDEHGEAGAILGFIFSEADPPPVTAPTKDHTVYADGAVLEYDSETHELKAILPGGGLATIEAPGGVSITGDVSITGKLDVSGAGAFGAETTAPEFTAGLIKLTAHKHPTAGMGPPSPPVP